MILIKVHLPVRCTASGGRACACNVMLPRACVCEGRRAVTQAGGCVIVNFERVKKFRAR